MPPNKKARSTKDVTGSLVGIKVYGESGRAKRFTQFINRATVHTNRDEQMGIEITGGFGSRKARVMITDDVTGSWTIYDVGEGVFCAPFRALREGHTLTVVALPLREREKYERVEMMPNPHHAYIEKDGDVEFASDGNVVFEHISAQTFVFTFTRKRVR